MREGVVLDGATPLPYNGNETPSLIRNDMNIYETFDPIVIDDFVPSWYQDALENMINETPLSYADNANHKRNTSIPIYGSEAELVTPRHSGGLALLVSSGSIIYHERQQATLAPMLFRLKEMVGPFNLVRTRLAMNLSDGVGGVHEQHVDNPTPHTVLLYYINDSDGDTILYKERADPLTYVGGTYPDSFTIDVRVTPKKGRAVIFDGLQFHSVSTPKEHLKRQIININILKHSDLEKNDYVMEHRRGLGR